MLKLIDYRAKAKGLPDLLPNSRLTFVRVAAEKRVTQS